jgi:hypothetical protein
MQTIKEQITYKIKLLGSDGKEYVQPIDAFIKEHVNICGVRDYLLSQIRERMNEVDVLIGLLKPQLLTALQPMFLDYMQTYHSKNSFHEFEACKGFSNSREMPMQFFKLPHELFAELLAEGIIQRKGKTGWFSFAPKGSEGKTE